MPPHVTVGTHPGHLPSYDVVSVVSIVDSMIEPESSGADGSGGKLKFNIESVGPYNQLSLSKIGIGRVISAFPVNLMKICFSVLVIIFEKYLML